MRHVLGYGGCYGENNYSVSKEVVRGMKLCAFMCSGIIVQGGGCKIQISKPESSIFEVDYT